MRNLQEQPVRKDPLSAIQKKHSHIHGCEVLPVHHLVLHSRCSLSALVRVDPRAPTLHRKSALDVQESP